MKSPIPTFDTGHIVIRASDGSLWEPSFPDGYGPLDLFQDRALGRNRYYFERVKPSGRKWWQFWKPKWIYFSGGPDQEVWCPQAELEFDIVKLRELEKFMRRTSK